MATPIQQLKGTAVEILTKTYAVGVLVWNETAKRWHGGDGVTLGGIAMARYDERNDGSLGDTQRVETGATNAVTVADIGKAIVGNRATAIAFNLDPAASLTSKFVAMFKNIGVGAMTVVPNGTELIDGANVAVTVPTGSSLIIKGDGTSFHTFLSNGDVTASAINNAPALTGANLADNDKIGVYDTSATGLVGMVISELVAGIFKTARKIANGYFLSSFRVWDTADPTKGLAFVLTAIAAGQTRNLIMPNRDVDLDKVTTFRWATAVLTSGTSVEFPDLPAGLQELKLSIDKASLSGTSQILVQMGTSGGWVTTGYLSGNATARSASASTGLTSVAGFVVSGAASAGAAIIGIFTLLRSDGNDWVGGLNGTNITLPSTPVDQGVSGGGSISLGGEVTRIRLISSNGTDTFDNGRATLFVTF